MKITVKQVFKFQIHTAKLRSNTYVLEVSSEQAPNVLAHWTYTHDEWKAFTGWTKRRRGMVRYLLHKLFTKSPARIPQVIITSQQVWVGLNEHPFNSNGHEIRRIDIREANNFNILEITYVKWNGSGQSQDGIYIPVPKGKLKEAVIVHTHLSGLEPRASSLEPKKETII